MRVERGGVIGLDRVILVDRQIKLVFGTRHVEEAGGESSSPLYREGGSYLKGMAVNSTVIADLLLPFCEAASINIKEISRTVRKRIVVSLLFADNQAVHQKLFREQHMDWLPMNKYLHLNHNI